MKRPKLTDYLTSKFTTAAAESAPIKKSREGKRPSPISLRLNEAELAALRKASAGRSMNGYIRERLFGNATAVRLSKPASDDHEALARVLGALGRSDVFTSLAAISLALEEQRLVTDRRTKSAILDACDAVVSMRSDLLRALGLRKD
ncbi:hypothetical protein [uncultured Roseobacter sp.]|uniref:hypothetical protein n=1 Tax=uncultured Roseobacter sp. TaxID=114847 RepID=UPI00260594F9|nr:hypothetical protein [uncultured Roseobacter sp.]